MTNDHNFAASNACLLVLAATLVAGCIKHADYATEFHIQGTAVDIESDSPLENVRIDFIDTGLDYVRSKSRIPQAIGTGDRFGNFNLTFGYWWGKNEHFFSGDSEEAFALEFSKDGYEPKRIDFSSSKIRNSKGALRLNLNKIHLQKSLIHY